MGLLAASAAFLAGWFGIRGVPTTRLQVSSGDGSPRGQWAAWRWRVAVPALVAVGIVGGLALDGGRGAAIGFAVSLPTATAVVLWRRHRLRSAAQVAAGEVAGACRLLAGLIRVGHVPAAALAAAARDAPVLAEPAAVMAIGGDVCGTLRRQGERLGLTGLVELAAAWEVAERTGASLTATLDALTDRLTATRKVDEVVAAELSAPRATGRLLAALPVAGLGLGYAFGGDPLLFLTGSPLGQLSLVAGVALGCAGVFWTERIADRAGG